MGFVFTYLGQGRISARFVDEPMHKGKSWSVHIGCCSVLAFRCSQGVAHGGCWCVLLSVGCFSREIDIRPVSQQLSHRIENGSSTSHSVITLVGWQMYKLPKSCSKCASPPAQLPHFHLARHLTAEKVEERGLW